MLPGGMPGAANLYDHEGVCKAVCDQVAAGSIINLDASVSGLPVMYRGLSRSVAGNQIKSLVFALSGVFLILTIIFGSFTSGLLATFPTLLFIAEVYQPWRYAEYIRQGGFDYLYDKVGLYDTLIAILKGHESATAITRCWASTPKRKRTSG